MKKIAFLLAVVHYFKSHPESKTCHQTSDGLIFHEQHSAMTHANDTLKDGDIETYERKDLEAMEAELKELQAKEAEETVDHTVTKEDLEANPELEEAGVKVGETIQLPKADTTAKKTAAKKAASGKK